MVSSFGDTCRNLLIWGLSQLLLPRVILSLWTQLRGRLSATFMLTCSISSSYPAVILNPAKDTILWCWMDWEGSGRSIWPPGHIITPQGAGVRNTPWILAAVKSFTILHMPTPCVFSVSYHTIPFYHLQPYFWISFKLSKSITEAQMQRRNFLFHTATLKYVEPGTNIFLMALEREIRLSLKPPPLNGLFWLIDQDPPTPTPPPQCGKSDSSANPAHLFYLNSLKRDALCRCGWLWGWLRWLR